MRTDTQEEEEEEEQQQHTAEDIDTRIYTSIFSLDSTLYL
jgi:hypothetical protein